MPTMAMRSATTAALLVNSSVAVKPQVDGTIVQILAKVEALFNAANFTNIGSAFTGILIVEVAAEA